MASSLSAQSSPDGRSQGSAATWRTKAALLMAGVAAIGGKAALQQVAASPPVRFGIEPFMPPPPS